MARVLPIALLAACSGGQGPGGAPTAPLGGSAAVPDSIWDQGTFVVVDKDKVAADTEESFQIWKTATGYRFTITWKRPLPTGEPADGKVTLETDAKFSPLTGEDVMNLHGTGGVETTRSTLRRDTDGRLATEVVTAAGTDANKSTRPNDWFIGGRLTTFLTVMCQASPDFTAPVVYPDKDTTLVEPKLLPIEGSTREVFVRLLTYTASQNKVIAACEDGKLVGEVTRGVTIVRSGDLALARTLEKWFR